MAPLRFKDWRQPKPPVKITDAFARIRHLAVLTYAVPPERLRPYIHPRFELITLEIGGKKRALLSVVPFYNDPLASVLMPFFGPSMGQVNYRAYVTDTTSGERGIWFFDCVLDSMAVAGPKHVFNLPWRRGRVRFSTDLREALDIFEPYRVAVEDAHGPAEIAFTHGANPRFSFAGFPDTETALIVLGHTLLGFNYRRDGLLSGYATWHPQLPYQVIGLEYARIALLDREGWVPFDEQTKPHSVLWTPLAPFITCLPPNLLEETVPAA
jgi:hypothetical protein